MAKKVYVGTNVQQITLTNILTNGSLTSSTTGWTISDKNTLTQNSGYVNIKCTETSSSSGTFPNYQVHTTISGSTPETNQKIYYQAKVRGKSTNTSFPRVYERYYKNGGSTATYVNASSTDGKSGTRLNDGSWHTMSGYLSTYISESEYRSYDRVAFGISAGTTDDTMDAKEFMVINLTEAFGRGNEPTKAWCDANISFFEGTTIIHQSVPGQGTATAIKNIYVGVPKDYKLVSYIESTGTQYIDTNYKPYKTTTELKFQYNTIPSTNGVTLCGVYNDNNNRYYALYYSNTNGICCSDKSATQIVLKNPADTDIHTIIYNDSNNKVFLDGVEKGTVSNLTTTSSYPLYLFARRGSSSAEVLSSGRIYYCKIWEENTLVRDFIPVLDEDNIPCLYDKITRECYYNQGTGTFKYGYEIDENKSISTGKSYTPIEYIQSSGTQCIDTSVVTQDNMKIVTDLEFVTNALWSTRYCIFGNSSDPSKFQLRTIAYNNDYYFALNMSRNGSSNSYYDSSKPSINENQRYLVEAGFSLTSQYLKVDGTEYWSGTYSDIDSPTNQYSDLLFSNSTSGSDGVRIKLYNAKIYINNFLVRDFIPVKDENNVACLFDKISNNFFYNAGTGNFTAGSDTGNLVNIQYEPLNFIESTGTQYIDTGVYADNNTRIKLKASPTKFEEEWQCIFSSKTAYQQNEYVLQVHQTNNNWYSSYGTNNSRDVDIVLKKEYICDKNKNITNINGTTMTLATETFTATQPGYIFADNESGACHFWRGKLYYLKIYDDATLVRDFIPVLTQEGIVGLYDQLNDKFYVSETNNLIAGRSSEFNTSIARKVRRGYVGVRSQYQELEYLESTGTQYINTGIIPTQNTRTKIAFSLTNGTQGQYAGMMGYQNADGSGSSNYRLSNAPESSFQFNGGSDYIIAENTERYKYYVADCSMNTFIVNGISHSSSGQTWTTASGSIYLFGRYSSESSAVVSSTLCSARLYYCKIYENNVLVRDFIPVLDENNIPCLYDKITYKCFYNIGTGAFDYGYKLNKPKGTVLEYIESTGAQYIDTGMQANNNMSIEMKVKFNSDYSTTEGIWCSRESGSVNTYTLFRTTGNVLRPAYNTTSVDLSDSIIANTEYILKQDKNKFYVNEILKHTFTTGTFTSPNNLILFASNNYSSSNPDLGNYSKFKLYYCKIWNGDTLVRNLEPVLDYDGIPCLYDWVSQSYFYNKGTGQFLYGYYSSTTSYTNTGKKYTQLDYIQSTGTQYIDTGFNVTPNSRITMSLQHTSYAQQDRFFGSYDTTGLYCCTYINGSNYYAFAYQDNSGNWVSTSKTAKNNTTLNIDYNGKAKTMTLSGAVSYSGSLSSYTATKGCKNTLVLFGGKVESGAIAGLAKMKLYSCNIYNDGVLVRNFIPVKDENGVACLFDRISQNFFYNAGTGDFTAGSVTQIPIATEYQEINYIESTGNQYINTNYIGAAKIEMKMKFKTLNPDSSEGNNALIWAENSAAPWGCNGIRYGLYGSEATDQYWQISGGNTVYYNYPSIDTEYILEGNTSITDDTVNYSLKINNELVISGSDTASLTSNPLYLFANNQNVFAKHFSAIKLYYCKIWDNNDVLIRDFVPVLNTNGQACLYDKVEEKFYENLSGNKFVIENTSSAKVITPAVAREFYHVPNYKTFSSSIVPTSWSGSGSAAGTTRTATNSWGTWTVKAVQATYNSSNYLLEKAFDSDDSTYTRGTSSGEVFTCQIHMPTNIKMKPDKARAMLYRCKANTTHIKGYNGTWNILYTQTTAINGSATPITPTLSAATDYYSIVEMYTDSSSGYTSRIYDFKITSGTVEDDRL